jgi:hypothetical protein
LFTSVLCFYYFTINILFILKKEISSDDETINDDATTLELVPLEQEEYNQG